MHAILKKEGWTVSKVENGRAALECLQRERPGLILLDRMMPEMDGFEFVAQMRRHAQLRSIPIVVLTAHLTGKDRRRLNGCVREGSPKDGRLARGVAARVTRDAR